MDNNKTFELDLNTDTFKRFKDDFNRILSSTLREMEQRKVNEADISVKMSIKLTDLYFANIDKDCTVPDFTHKITAKMQVKEESSGRLNGVFDLKQDEETGRYYLEAIRDNQTTMFDEEEIEEDD